MHAKVPARGWASLAVVLAALNVSATTLPRLSFEQLTDDSDRIVSGRITRTWSAWDAGHRYIWTHYEVAVDAAHKGAASSTLEIAEPGGIVGDRGMTIAGSVHYTPGENVVVFASRMPNGMLRTTGWGQGKYGVDRSGLLHADTALRSAELVDTKLQRNVGLQATPLRSLEGMTVRELSARIAARVQTTQRSAR